jgi:putative transposase
VKYAWIQEHHNRYTVSMMCVLLKVSRKGYYRWLKHGEKREDSDLVKYITEIFNDSFKSYGTRRIKKELETQYGWIVSRRRIGRVMRKEGLKARSKQCFKIQTTDSNHSYPISPNLLNQDFYASAPNEVYVGDITYIRTSEGWLYLAVVIDLYARVIVGWAIDAHMQTSLVTNALKKTKERRGSLQGTIFHSDRGSQYASDAYRKQLEEYGIEQSMSAKGNCYDNAACESFFGSLKTELIYPTKLQTQKEVQASIAHYIGFYNTKRLHSYNDYIAPLKMELWWWKSRFRESA